MCETGTKPPSPKWITLEKRHPLWITQGLCQNCAQGLQGKTMVLSFESLFKHMQLLIEVAECLAFRRNLSNRMQNRGVVSATKQLTDFR